MHQLARTMTTAGLGLLLIAGTATPAEAAADNARITSRGTMAFQANTSRLWVANFTTAKELSFAMMPGSSPAVAGFTTTTVPYFGTVVFQGANGNLWTASASSGSGADRGLAMAPRTSPSISINQRTIAFQGANGNLWTLGGDSGLAMAPGTNPHMANGNRIVFQGADGTLWTNSGGTGRPMAPGTSPAIEQGGVIAWQGATGTLWVKKEFGEVVDTGYGMAPGTSPSIATEYRDPERAIIAFQGDDGHLHTTVADPERRNNDRDVAMMPGTSPTVSSDNDTIAFQGLNGNLHEGSTSGRPADRGLGMAPGTSPG